MSFYDLQSIKPQCAGRWPAIIQSVTGIGPDYMTGRHGPCPRCGGKDRWRVFDDFTSSGGATCNQCGKFADGFALVRWARNATLNESIQLVAESIGHTQPAKPKRPIDAHLKWQQWNDSLFAIWSTHKPGITREAIEACGGRMAKYRNRYLVLALPIIGQGGKPVGYALYNLTGGTLPAWRKDQPKPDQVKILTISGSQAGWIGPPVSQPATVQWKTEGPSDLLALLSLGLPPGHTACCNAFGCGENAAKHPWLIERFAGSTTYVVHDCDEPGQAGATTVRNGKDSRPGWAPVISTKASECRNVVLPYPIAPSHGKDLRDWIGEQRAKGLANSAIYDELLRVASTATIQGKAIQVGDKLVTAVLEADDDPHLLARLNLEGYRRQGRDIRFWRGEFYQYKGDRYSRISRASLECRIGESIKAYVNKNWMEAGNTKKAAPKVSTRLIRDVMQATASQAYLKNSQELNSWIGNGRSNQCVAMRNGILDLHELFKAPEIRDKSKLFVNHNHKWFSCVRLPYDFDPEATCPTWRQFLNDVFNGDIEAIACLQKWFGYLLTDDTSLHKILFVIGERRSGKGTILRTLIELLGREAVASQSLSDLEGPFALQSLIDKTAVIIPDARLSGRSDQVKITERMLSISGEDPQTIQRKYMESLNSVRLPVRFTLFSNMLPSLSDSANAFPSRCLFLAMPNSYLGREDTTLFDRIRDEMSGILNWAIAGRWMLRLDKRIDQPRSGAKLMLQMQSIASPVSVFIDQECTRTGEIESRELFDRWCAWCSENDIINKKDLQRFIKGVRDVLPSVSTDRRWTHMGNKSFLVGVSLKQQETLESSTSSTCRHLNGF